MTALARLSELQDIAAALSSDLVALERELKGCAAHRPSLSAVNALQAVIGEIELAHIAVRQVATGLRSMPVIPTPERLSHREREVLRGLSRGETISEIARSLRLSVKTVSTYRTRLQKKLRLETTAQLVRYGITSHLSD
jgi:DNA-binding NarL/FixJ family response regulator